MLYTRIVNLISINKKNPEPLYLQIYHSVKQGVDQGHLRDQDALPYEEMVADFYHISRQVVRQAYALLEEEGLVVRTRRKGTRISLKPLLILKRSHLLDLKQYCVLSGYAYRREVLLIETILHKHIEFPYVFKNVVPYIHHIVYLIYINQQPFALQEYFLPSTCQIEEKAIVDESFNLINHLEVHQKGITAVRFRLRPHLASSIEALSLGVEDETVLAQHHIDYLDDQHTVVLSERLSLIGHLAYVHQELERP